VSWRAVARKDLLAEARSRETLVPLVLLALLVAAVGMIAFHDVHEPAVVASAIVWLALAFASALGLARAFGAERDRGTLDTLLALPIDRVALFLGKGVASLAMLGATAVVIVPGYFLASGGPMPPAAFYLVLALGAVGLAATGTILSALAAQARTRDLMMPVLLFPLLVPLLLAGIHGTQDVLERAPFAEWRPELLVLAGYDLAFVAAGALLFDEAVGP
jgi:heme exporter protein B